MRRAHFSSGGSARSNQTSKSTESPPAEYVINWRAIFAALLLLAVLVGVPAALFAWQPSWFGFTSNGEDAGPMVFAVDTTQIQTPPPASEQNAALESVRRKQLRDAADAADDRNDATRRIRPSPFSRPSRKTNRKQNRPEVSTVDTAKTRPAAAEQNETSAAPPFDPHGMLYSVSELFEQLRETPELRLDDTGELTSKLVKAAKTAKPKTAAASDGASAPADGLPDSSMLRDLVTARQDLAGLPFQWDGDCKIEGDRLKSLADVSRNLRRIVGAVDLPSSGSSSAQAERRAILVKLLSSKKWLTPDHVSALEQMLQSEGDLFTSPVLDACSSIDGAEASQAIAHRALYEISPEVRAKAIDALREREPKEYQSVLVDALRYPWPPVAVNAAHALVELNAYDTVPQLQKLAELPSPTAPERNDQGEWTVRELVKINHFRNCALCHAPVAEASSRTILAGFIPTPGKPIPVAYYSQPTGGDFVRADITYLRQDFSLMEYVETSHEERWPEMQRFDFLVRTRVLPPEEQERLEKARPIDSFESPQREAILYALRHLTGDSP